MDYLLVTLAALFAGALTLISGFGLNTILLPVFMLLFPEPTAVAAVALVHLANNLFKLGLVGRHAQRAVVLRFGIPAVLAALVGAALFQSIATSHSLTTYELVGRRATITPARLTIGLLIGAFAAFELVPRFQRLAVPPRYLPIGGLLSGFFGGLSGHQGALRSVFLVRSGLSKEQFVGTSAVCATLVDATRLVVYLLGFGMSRNLRAALATEVRGLVLVGCVAAFIGSYFGAKLLGKTTLHTVRIVIGIFLGLTAAGIASGLL